MLIMSINAKGGWQMHRYEPLWIHIYACLQW